MSDGTDLQSEHNSEMIKNLQERTEAFLQERRRDVAIAKAENQDKELFDINSFRLLYSLRGDDGSTNLTPELVESLEAEYYLDNPGIKSMGDFAQMKQDFDADLS